MIVIRPMSKIDLPLGRQLTQQAGWNQTDADLHRFLWLQPSGCFVAELASRSVGTVTTCVFDRVGWIGMLVVQEASRRRGVGRALLHKAIEYLETQGVQSMRLDATGQGQPLYETLGFTAQFRLTRFSGVVGHGRVGQASDPLRQEDWEQVVALDKMVVGYERRRLLIRLVQEPDSHAFIDRRGESIRGYVLTRAGRRAVHIGPCLAKNTTAGGDLMAHVLNRHRGQSVIVDTPNDNHLAAATLTSFGLEPARGFLRMCRGDLIVEQLDHLWAGSGPEKG